MKILTEIDNTYWHAYLTNKIEWDNQLSLSFRNRELVYDLYTYLWDMCGVVQTLDGFVQWMSKGSVSPKSQNYVVGQQTWFSGIREAFSSGDHEPWMFRGESRIHQLSKVRWEKCWKKKGWMNPAFSTYILNYVWTPLIRKNILNHVFFFSHRACLNLMYIVKRFLGAGLLKGKINTFVKNQQKIDP